MNTIKTKLYTLVKTAVGSETVIWADQNSPRPPFPFWTLRLQSIRSVGESDTGQGVSSTGAQSVVNVREATLAVQRFGIDSDLACQDFKDTLTMTTMVDLWFTNKIALFNVGAVNNLTTKLDNAQLEPRAALDLFIRFNSVIVDSGTGTGVIETVNVTGEYETNDTTADFDANADLTHTFQAVLQ
jgi:hypothetical protein